MQKIRLTPQEMFNQLKGRKAEPLIPKQEHPPRVWRTADNPTKNTFENRVTPGYGYPVFEIYETFFDGSESFVKEEVITILSGQKATSVILSRYGFDRKKPTQYKIILTGWEMPHDKNDFTPAKW